jgi:hypothetical protein
MEGAAMRHCVATYWQNVVNGQSRICSILEKGNRVATLELTSRVDRGRYQVGQLVGVRNSRTIRCVQGRWRLYRGDQ